MTAATSYQYFVRAFDTEGRESADSAHVTLTTAGAPVLTGSCTPSGSGSAR